MLPMLLWFAASLLIGFCGISRKFGFWGFFFVSLFLSPLAGLLLVVASTPTYRHRSDW
jgi:hypothetical protein